MPRTPADRIGWYSLDRYVTIHDAQLRRLGDYFIEHNGLMMSRLAPDKLQITGRIQCRSQLFVDVAEILTINDRGRVRCQRYKYHAGVTGSPARSIFRYDNAHVYSREGHQDAFHKHRFDHVTWEEIVPPIWIGRGNWPTLAEVIDELYDWWHEIGRFLSLE